jgi:hypothetical protein
MPLSTNDFINQVKCEVNYLYSCYSYKSENKNYPFTQWLLEVLYPSLDSDYAFNLVIEGANDSNIYATYKDEENAIFYLISTFYSEDPETTIGPGKFYELMDMIRVIKNSEPESIKSESILAEAVQAKNDGYTVSAIFAVMGMIDGNTSIQDMFDKYQISSEEFKYYNLSEGFVPDSIKTSTQKK